VRHYLVIESRDPFECNDVAYCYALTKDLAEGGDEVTLLLVQNGVLAARPSSRTEALTGVQQSGVSVLADDFSLKERGVGRLADGISAATIEVIVDHLEAGHRVLWH
jgi:hypothetical protein